MKKQSRYQSVVNRQSDESYSEDHWLKQFEDKLQKTSVQPYSKDLYEQISYIMNGSKSRYPSVQAAVDDMMQRSGLSSYLENVKISSEDENIDKPKKTAQQKDDPRTPEVIKRNPNVLQTLQNIINDSRGNLSVPAIINKLHSFHGKDISDENVWDDDKLIRLVSYLNLKAKTDNPSVYDNYNELGRGDHMSTDRDIDPSNTDAFNALMPAKI